MSKEKGGLGVRFIPSHLDGHYRPTPVVGEMFAAYDRQMASRLFQYSRGFLELQIGFARRVSRVTGAPLAECLREFTMLESSELFGTRRDPAAWQEFIAGVDLCKTSLVDWAEEFYLARLHDRPSPSTGVRVGCFLFDYIPDDHSVSLHLLRDPSGESTLGHLHRAKRIRELHDLFQVIKNDCPDAVLVRGRSWLYHIDAYRSLYPPEYLATAKPIGYVTNGPSLWGQFVATSGLREPAASDFRAKVECADSQQVCVGCFPFDVLSPECSIEVFYRHFGV